MTEKEAVAKYNEYLEGHIGNVQEALRLFKDLEIPFVVENYEELEQICSKHDESKYSEEEFLPYREHFYSINNEEKLKSESFEMACRHHIANNKHHWDYWLNNDGELDIPDEHEYKLYCVERCADWLSMANQHNEGPMDWYNANKDAMIMPDYGFELCEEILSKVPSDFKLSFDGVRGKLDESTVQELNSKYTNILMYDIDVFRNRQYADDKKSKYITTYHAKLKDGKVDVYAKSIGELDNKLSGYKQELKEWADARSVTTDELNNNPVYISTHYTDDYGQEQHTKTDFNNIKELFKYIDECGGFNQFTDHGKIMYFICSDYKDGEFYYTRDWTAKGGWSWKDCNGVSVPHEKRQFRHRGSLEESDYWKTLHPQIEDDESDRRGVEMYKERIQNGEHRPVLVNADGEILDGNHTMTAYLELGIKPPMLYRGERKDFYSAAAEAKWDAEKAIYIMIDNGTATLVEAAGLSKEYLKKKFKKVKFNSNFSSAEIITEYGSETSEDIELRQLVKTIRAAYPNMNLEKKGLPALRNIAKSAEKKLEKEAYEAMEKEKKHPKYYTRQDGTKMIRNDAGGYEELDESNINSALDGYIFDNQIPHYDLSPDSDYVYLFTNTKAENLKSIDENGLKVGQNLGSYSKSPEEGLVIWCDTNSPESSGYGGCTITFKVPKDEAERCKVNNTQHTIPRDIDRKDILFIDRILCNHPVIKVSDIPAYVNKFGEDKLVDALSNHGLHIPEATVRGIISRCREMNLVESFKVHKKPGGYLLEASMSQLKRTTLTQDPTRAKKSKSVHSKYIGISKYGVLNFMTTSETHSGVQWYQEIQFPSFQGFMNIVDQGDVIEPDDVQKAMKADNIKISCDDPSFLYWAWKYKAWRDVYGLEKETRAPQRNNTRLRGALCKHLYSVVELVNQKRIVELIARDLNVWCAKQLGIEVPDGYQDPEGMMQKDFKANQYDYNVESVLKDLLSRDNFKKYMDGTPLEDLGLSDKEMKDIEDAIKGMRDRSQFQLKTELEKEFEPVKRGRKITRDDIKLTVGNNENEEEEGK